MTLVSLPSPIAWPGLTGNGTGAPFLANSTTIDAAGEYVAYVAVAREDMVVSHVGFRSGTATGSPTVDVRIETVDATGLPSGTLFGTDTNLSDGVAITTNANVLKALTASASITKGQAFCVKIAYVAGTSLQIIYLSTTSSTSRSNLPYAVFNTGTPTKTVMQDNTPTISLGSSSTTFYRLPGFIPASAASASTFNNTSSARRGLRFTPPMNCRAIGLRWFNGASTGDYNAILFNDAGTELSSSSTAFDGDLTAANAGGNITVYFDNTVTLTAGTTYRIAIEPSSATNVTVATITLPSVDYRGASPAGTTAHYTTYVASSWTDTATDQIPLMDVLLDQIDDGAGTGGVVGVIGG